VEVRYPYPLPLCFRALSSHAIPIPLRSWLRRIPDSSPQPLLYRTPSPPSPHPITRLPMNPSPTLPFKPRVSFPPSSRATLLPLYLLLFELPRPVPFFHILHSRIHTLHNATKLTPLLTADTGPATDAASIAEAEKKVAKKDN
jgi:hypothetical protein